MIGEAQKEVCLSLCGEAMGGCVPPPKAFGNFPLPLDIYVGAEGTTFAHVLRISNLCIHFKSIYHEAALSSSSFHNIVYYSIYWYITVKAYFLDVSLHELNHPKKWHQSRKWSCTAVNLVSLELAIPVRLTKNSFIPS